jgi:hypothetical protein
MSSQEPSSLLPPGLVLEDLSLSFSMRTMTVQPGSGQPCSNRLAPRADVDVAVVLAKREYEAWFLAAAESVAGLRSLTPDLAAPHDPESIRGAKEWLRQRMTEGSTYSPTLDQPALTAQFDLDAARCADSFDKCVREIRRLIGCG